MKQFRGLFFLFVALCGCDRGRSIVGGAGIDAMLAERGEDATNEQATDLISREEPVPFDVLEDAVVASDARHDVVLPDNRRDAQSDVTCDTPIVAGDGGCPPGKSLFAGTCVTNGYVRFSFSWTGISRIDLHVHLPNREQVWDPMEEYMGVVNELPYGSGDSHRQNFYLTCQAQRGTYRFCVDDYFNIDEFAPWRIEIFDSTRTPPVTQVITGTLLAGDRRSCISSPEIPPEQMEMGSYDVSF